MEAYLKMENGEKVRENIFIVCCVKSDVKKMTMAPYSNVTIVFWLHLALARKSDWNSKSDVRSVLF